MGDERATILFSPELPDVPGSFNMVEIRTGGDAMLERLHGICLQLSRGERDLVDLLRELPAEGVWVSGFRAHRVSRREDTRFKIAASRDLETCEIDWSNTAEGWDAVSERVEDLLGDSQPGVLVALASDIADSDGFLSVER
jgi:hypothetical protein